LLLMAMRGAENEKIKVAFDSYLKKAYPFVNLGDAEEDSRKKIAEELDIMSSQAIVFQNPMAVKRNPLKGPGSRVLEESARLKRERKKETPK